MANSSSARKRIRSSERKHEQNRAVRSAVRTAVSRARKAIVEAEDGAAAGLVGVATSALDKAAEHGVLHRRNASRRKSRLMRLAAKVSAEAVVVAAHPVRKRAATAKGTKPKASAATRKPAAKPQTKTERTATRTRRTAGSSSSERS